MRFLLRLITISFVLSFSGTASYSLDANDLYNLDANDLYNLIKSPSKTADERIIIAGICFASGSSVSGMNRICYYNCVGGTAAITIKSFKLCPLTIRD